MKYLIIPNFAVLSLTQSGGDNTFSMLAQDRRWGDLKLDQILLNTYYGISKGQYILLEGPDNRGDNPIEMFSKLSDNDPIIFKEPVTFTTDMIGENILTCFSEIESLFIEKRIYQA